VFFNGVWGRWQIILSKDSKKIKEKIMSDEPVDSFTRALGWFIACVFIFGLYMVVQYIDSLHLDYYINLIIAVPFFWGSFIGQGLLIDKFDLFGDRKNRR